MATYKTPGRERLLQFLQEHPDRQYTADELVGEINREKDNSSVNGRSTVYRHLSELCSDGTVRKYRGEDRSVYVYQFVGQADCSHHFHLKCVGCGRVVHLDCAVSKELLAHIHTDHHFDVDSGRSILYGMCADCKVSESPM